MTDEGENLAGLQQGIEELAVGELDRAAVLFQQLAEAEPENRSPYWYLGVALLLLGQEAEAQTTWMLAMVEGSPEQIEQWTAELVAVLRSQAEQQESLGRAPNAWAIRQHLREIAPTDLPNLLHLLARSTELPAFEPAQLSELIPSLGILPLLQTGTIAAIDQPLLLQTLERLLEVAPLEPATLEFAEAGLVNHPEPGAWVLALLGTAIRVGYGMGQARLAVNYAQLCLQTYPTDLNILSHLAGLYQRSNQHSESIEAARQICLLAQSIPEQVIAVFILLRSLLKAGGYWEEIFALSDLHVTLIQQLISQPPDPLPGADVVLQLVNSTFFQPYIRDALASNRQMHNAVQAFCQSCVETYAAATIARYRQGFATRQRDPDRPLRVGYVSHCLKRHSVGWLCRWLFQHHDRDRFEIYGYFWNYEPNGDELQQWFLNQVTVARTFRCDSQAIADQIFADEIDILVDLDSLTSDLGCEVMMLKPAPIQVTWLGWDAMGSPAIDYFIADPYVLPETAAAHYCEKIWRLPQTYIAVDGFEIGIPSLRRDQLNIPADAVVYWSGQSPFKRHPETVRSQLEIIKAVPNSYFLIKGIVSGEKTDAELHLVERYFLELAIEVGVDPDRLRFLPEVALEAVHRADLGIADIVLDTYPYNGATTTMETLWMGIPIVTRAGEHFSSRNSYTMMLNAGITEGIAWSAAEYVEWGIRLGRSPELRQQIAWKLWKSRQTAPLWNGKQFARDMEAAYTGMWHHSQANPVDWKPDWEQVAIAQVQQGQLEAAAKNYQKALAIDPQSARLHYSLGVVWQQLNDWETAIAHYQQAGAIDPHDRKVWTNLGALLQEQGDPQAAIDCYEKILSIDPEDAIAHLNLSIVLLQQGNWSQGWAEFEWRWRLPDKTPRDFAQPLWDGADLKDTTLLIHAEEGYGDTIQFIRFVPQVAQRGGRVVVECPPGLVRLLSTIPGIAAIIPFGTALPAFAVHAPLMSLPHLLGTTLETLPAEIPYLGKGAEGRRGGGDGKNHQFRPTLTPLPPCPPAPLPLDRLKIGIVWAGNPLHQRASSKSTCLEQFLPLLNLEGIEFYSLQKEPRSRDLAEFPQRSQIQDLSVELDDFADTAAAIDCLDLVISVDTAVAHLAGALGKPVWLLLAHNADWRWMLDRDDSPWYPTMRLFRQTQRGDWADVFAKVTEALRAIVAAYPRV